MIPNVTIPVGTAGPWTIDKFTVGREPTIHNLRLMRDGRGVAPGEYTRLRHAQRGVVMSDTTAEKRDHYAFVRAAYGHVLINGLGIGMCLNACLQKANVEQITVVEIDPDIIGLVGPHYTDPRVNIVHASAFDFKPPKGVRFGAVWHDIWDSICEDNLPEMHRLHRRYGRLTDWQGSWGRDTIELQRRRTRNEWWRR